MAKKRPNFCWGFVEKFGRDPRALGLTVMLGIIEPIVSIGSRAFPIIRKLAVYLPEPLLIASKIASLATISFLLIYGSYSYSRKFLNAKKISARFSKFFLVLIVLSASYFFYQSIFNASNQEKTLTEIARKERENFLNTHDLTWSGYIPKK